ncbi:MAG: inositol-3-phosphate synthase, partial [Planctomycetota bacterium]
MAKGRTGIWLVGARGSVATTVAVGLAALRRGDAATVGLVTETPPLVGVDLPGWDQLAIGGHEVRSGTLADAARELEAARVVPHGSAERYADELSEIDARIRPGVLFRSGEAIQAMADEPCVAVG